MQLGHLLTRSGLTHPEVSWLVSPGVFCLLVCSSFSIPGNLLRDILCICCNYFFLYSVQNWGLYLVLLHSVVTFQHKCDKLLKSSRLLSFNFGFLCFVWKFRLFLWPHFRCTWVSFWRVGPYDSSGSFVFMSWCVCCISVMRLGYGKDRGLIPGQNKFVFSSQRAHPASCITGTRDSFLEVISWREPVHCVLHTSSWHVS